LKAAFDWKVRKNLARGVSEEKGFKVIHFQQAFHGRTGYTLSLTNTFDPRKTQYYPKFDWPRIINPKCVFPLEGENLVQVQKLESQALDQIDQVIGQGSDQVACILLEPIQAEGGDNQFRPEFHRELRRICDENEMLLIYDEVQTGLGATGTMWAFEHYVQPDLLAFGKKTQVCGMLAGPRIDEVPDNVFAVPGRIDSTWSGSLVDMVRCKHYLEVFDQDNLVENSRRMGEVLLEELEGLEQEFPAVSNARGRGLFCAFDLPDSDFRDRLREKLFENHLIILPCGERSIRFRTALNIPRETLLEGTRIIREVLHQI
jgi:L-lysine 6-transaminase